MVKKLVMSNIYMTQLSLPHRQTEGEPYSAGQSVGTVVFENKLAKKDLGQSAAMKIRDPDGPHPLFRIPKKLHGPARKPVDLFTAGC
jgi:hypothetical protein